MYPRQDSSLVYTLLVRTVLPPLKLQYIIRIVWITIVLSFHVELVQCDNTKRWAIPFSKVKRGHYILRVPVKQER